jgi:hypothetical protein
MTGRWFDWRVMGLGVGLGLSCGLLSSCSVPSSFSCSDDSQCGEGQCIDGACAFPDDECLSGLAYGALAPKELAGNCVEDGVADESGSSGDGDGDGDPTGDGDGDGDPTGDGDGDGDGDLPDGASCSADSECQSGKCYVIPILGGECGECNSDADCPGGGCSAPNVFVDDLGPTCNLGEAGAGCETDAACMNGLSCELVVEVLELRGCSECSTNSDCMGQNICIPQVELGDYGGSMACSPPATLANDSYCDVLGAGNDACSSMACAEVDILGQASLGVCGECNDQVACPMGQTCLEPSFDPGTGALTGSVCQ